MDDHAIQEYVDPTQAFFSHAASRPPNFPRSMQASAEIVPIPRVQKLDEHMSTLLHLIQPWMEKSIEETEDHIENWVSKQGEQQIQTFHKRLDAFELRTTRPRHQPYYHS